MKKKLLFLFSMMFLMLFSFTARAQEDAEYEAALAAIGEGGTYFISTDVNGVPYYVTAAGKLTSVRADGCIFTLSKVEGGAYRTAGYYIDGGGTRFTNAPLSNNQAVLNVANYSTTSNNRADWEAQVLFLNENGKYAIRATNAGYGESSWADAGRVFFTWAVEEVPIPQYTYEQVYQWQFEAVTPITVSYQLMESDGTLVGDPVTAKQEGNSEIRIPSSFTSVAFYDYTTEGTIGSEDCTINVIRSMKSGVVQALTELSNDKAYTIRCDRGAFLTKDGYMVSTAYSSYADAEATNFAIVSYEEHFYLYSVADKQFVTNNGALADMPTHGILDAICFDVKNNPYFMGYFTVAEGTNYGLNTNGNGPYGYVINSWMNADAGNQYYMIEAADFDATDALKSLEDFFHPSYFVTYVVKDAAGNVLFTSEPAPAVPGQKITTLPDDYKKGFTTYSEVDVTISEVNTTVEFTATPNFPFEIVSNYADATWYNMTIRGDYWVAMDESEPYYPKADKDLDADASKWAFAGDAYSGIVIYNRAAGEGKTLTNADGNVVMRDGEFKWEIFSNSDGFVMRPMEGEGRDNMWVNQNGGSSGPLQFWNSTSGKTDNGSTFRITPATPVYSITIAASENGSVEANLAEAKAGEKIRLTITPAEGYELDALTVKVGDEDVEVSKSYTFDMPAGKVNITATFKVESEKEIIYIESDLTAQFPLDYQGWNGATGLVGWAAPAVTTNDGRSTAACERYEGTCANTGVVFSRTLTGLANGVYNIELYGAAAYTSGRGFESELEEGDETAVYLYAETPAGKVQQFIPAHVADNFNGTGIATAMLENVEVTDGTITIGMAKDKPMTNWHVVQIKGVTAKVNAAELLAATVATAKALDTNVLSSELVAKITNTIDEYNGTYDTADEYKTAIAAIEAVIAEAQIYIVAAPKLAAMKELVDATNFYTEEALATYYTTPAQKLAEGTLTMSEANALQNPFAVTGWHADITVDNFLLSVWDTNADFQDAAYYINSWSVEGENDGTEFKVPFFEYWTGDANSLGEKTLTASFEGLEPGKTVLTNVWVRVRAKNDVDAADATGITLQVNDGEPTDVTEGATVGQFNLATYAATGVVGEDGKLEVKFIVSADNNISWLSFKNAKYEYVDADKIEYATALYNIKDGENYSITTMVDGAKYYLTADGKLTADINAAGMFGFQKVKGAQFEYGFLLNSQNGTRFSNPYNTSEEWLTNGSLNTSTNNRSDWEAQVFFMKDGKLAVRGTNAAYAGQTSGWEWIGNTYWTVNQGEDGPLAEYSWEPQYVWQLEKNTLIDVEMSLVYEGEIVKKATVSQAVGRTPIYPAEFDNGLLNLVSDVETVAANTTAINVTATWNGLFEFTTDIENPKWYNMTIRGDYYVGKIGKEDEAGVMVEEPYYPIAFKGLEKAQLQEDIYQWAFVGNPFSVVVYNKAKGFTYSLTNDGGNAVLREGDSSWDIFGNADGFVLREAGTANNFINQSGGADGPLAFWNSTGAKTDNGSTFRVSEVPTAIGIYREQLALTIEANEPDPLFAGNGVFLKPQADYDTFKAVIDAQKAIAESETATLEELEAAITAVETAAATYDAVETTKPEEGQLYTIQNKGNGGYLSLNTEAGQVYASTDPQGFYFTATEDGYYLSNELGYVGIDGNNVIITTDENKALLVATPAELADGVTYYNILNNVEGGKYINGNTRIDRKVTLIATPKEAALWTIVKGLDLAVNVVRPIYPNQYQEQYAAIDVEAVKKFLGVEELTAENVSLSIINPNGDEITDYAGYDGWFGKDGSAQYWGENAFICVKMFQALSDGQFFLCHMNGPTTEDKVSVKWAFKANEKTVFYTVNVTFEEYVEPAFKPEIIKTIDIAHTELAETAYSEAEPAPTFDVAEVCNALGIADISEATTYIVNVTTGNFVENSTDGWRNADGDAAPWGECTNGFCVKLDDPASGKFNYTGAHDANFQEGDTYLAQWGIVANEKAVLLKVNVTFATTVGINGLDADLSKAEIYDLNGRKLNKVQKGGIYIINGKKVTVK